MKLQSIQWTLFQQRFWEVAFFIAFAVSTLKLIISKGRHLGAFILFILTIAAIGASLETCLSELALERYAFPTEFIYYLSVAFLPLLWLKNENEIHNANFTERG